MRWDYLRKPEGVEPQFEGHAKMPPFEPGSTAYSAVNAWWLSELCRLVYTPDLQERERPWHRGKTDREQWLAERTPFTEVHSFHKTGSHAAIFTGEIEGKEPFTILCFRGTNKLRQWILNLNAVPALWQSEGSAGDDNAGKDTAAVHQGFKILFDRIWPKIAPCLDDLPRPLFYTGHSLGGAFATLAAAIRPPDALYTFGSPCVGNPAFSERVNRNNPACYRIIHGEDIVPLLPEPDQRFGFQEIAHCGSPIHLNPPTERADSTLDAVRRIGNALCENTAVAPPGLSDHFPISYSRSLRAEVDRSRN